MSLKAKNPVDLILDENNNEDITLYDDAGNPIKFEQIALIPVDDDKSDIQRLYAILIPITPMEGVNQGEGVLFEIDEANKDLSIVRDEKIIDKVLTIYEKLISEGEGNK